MGLNSEQEVTLHRIARQFTYGTITYREFVWAVVKFYTDNQYAVDNDDRD